MIATRTGAVEVFRKSLAAALDSSRARILCRSETGGSLRTMTGSSSVSHIDGPAHKFSVPSLLQSNQCLRVDCFQANTKYWPDMHGKSTVHSWQESQVRRATVAGCVHFSYWSDGGRHIRGSSGQTCPETGVVTGLPLCPESCAEPFTTCGHYMTCRAKAKQSKLAVGRTVRRDICGRVNES